jgi:hypothetical protein
VESPKRVSWDRSDGRIRDARDVTTARASKDTKARESRASSSVVYTHLSCSWLLVKLARVRKAELSGARAMAFGRVECPIVNGGF